MYAFRGHLIGDDAAWCGVDWYTPYAITLAGAAVDLTLYTAAALVHPYAGGPVLFAMTATIDTPKTAGTGLLKILGTDTAAMAPGRYVYKLTLTPGTSSVTLQPIVVYGDLELRTR